MRYFSVFLVMLTLWLPQPAAALHPDEILADPVLEQRARAITRDVRCLVCQGEAIDESRAPLAADLRQLVRQRLMVGDSDAAVRDYLTHRYGDYILMQPPVRGSTLLLWGAPFVVLLLAGLLVWRHGRRQALPDGEG